MKKIAQKRLILIGKTEDYFHGGKPIDFCEKGFNYLLLFDPDTKNAYILLFFLNKDKDEVKALEKAFEETKAKEFHVNGGGRIFINEKTQPFSSKRNVFISTSGFSKIFGPASVYHLPLIANEIFFLPGFSLCAEYNSLSCEEDLRGGRLITKSNLNELL